MVIAFSESIWRGDGHRLFRKAITFAREHFAEHGRFWVADPQQVRLGLPDDAAFDVIISSEVIEHVVDHEALIYQFSLFLKPHGLLIMTTPNGRSFAAVEKRHRAHFQPVENWLTPPDLTHLIKQGGFEVLYHRGSSFKGIDFGARGFWSSKKVNRLTTFLRINGLYTRFLLYVSLYQFLVAKKKT